MIPNGRAVTSVIVCKEANPPERSKLNETTVSNTPQKAFCHLGESVAPFDEIPFIINIPESADVIKNTHIIAIESTFNKLVNGR